MDPIDIVAMKIAAYGDGYATGYKKGFLRAAEIAQEVKHFSLGKSLNS